MQPAIRIAVIGSSTAAGQGAEPPENGWVNLYRAYLKNLNPGNEVVNLALGGQQTYQLLPTGHRPPPARPVPDPERNITKALSYLPDAVLVNVPSNDAAAFYGATEQMRNFEAIAQAAQAAGVPVWIATTQPRAFSPRQIDIQIQVRDAILSRYGAQALDFWSPLALPSHLPNPKLVIGDGAHLNNRGHRLLFEMVRDKNLPAAIAEWKFRRRQLTRLEPGTQLDIPAFTGGSAFVEVYDDRARLRCRAQGTLPLRVQKRIGPPGHYWVRVAAGEGFNRLLPWLKTAGAISA